MIIDRQSSIFSYLTNSKAPVIVRVKGSEVLTKNTISVLGVTFDSKLTWGPQVSNAIMKATRALNALRLISRYFNRKELIQLVTSNVYSVLFYNSEIWHLNTLKQTLKNSIMSMSAKALRVCLKNYEQCTSFETLHLMAKRATPSKLMLYKLSLQLYRTFNHRLPSTEWNLLNDNIILTSRQTKFMTWKNNRLRLGMNTISNRFVLINDRFPLDWLNNSYETFKFKNERTFSAVMWLITVTVQSSVIYRNYLWANELILKWPLFRYFPISKILCKQP